MDRKEKLFMPLWQPFTGSRAETMIGSLSDEEERRVALAAHHYFQAKSEDAARESQRFLNSPCRRFALPRCFYTAWPMWAWATRSWPGQILPR